MCLRVCVYIYIYIYIMGYSERKFNFSKEAYNS